MGRLLLHMISVAALVAGSSVSDPRDPATLRGKIPSSVIRLNPGSHALLVEKATQSLILYRGDEDGTPVFVSVVRANTGEKQGDKEQEGDLRTPEGIYFFIGIIDGSRLPAEYGVRAFTTDFPNAFDVLERKNGSNIWLHATDQPERVEFGYNTRGCVVVTNEHLNQLTPVIRTGRRYDATPMIIEQDLLLLTPEQGGEIRADLEEFIRLWELAWESQDIDRYMAFYSRDYQGMGRDYDAWRTYKRRLTQQYEYIRVELSRLHIVQHDGELVATFEQEYQSDRFLARSSKRLYLRLEAGSWKIIRETSQPLQ